MFEELTDKDIYDRAISAGKACSGCFLQARLGEKSRAL
jgi:hypothetical protein